MIPDIVKQAAPENEALVSFLEANNEILRQYSVDILSLFDPVKTPYPIELANYLGAYIVSDDDIDDVRRKAVYARRTHNANLHFKLVWKPIIDGVLGVDSSVWRGNWSDLQFVIGESEIGVGSIGGFESNIKPWTPGDVLINLGVPVAPPTEDLQKVERQLSPLLPEYFSVYLGRVIEDMLLGDYFVKLTDQLI